MTGKRSQAGARLVARRRTAPNSAPSGPTPGGWQDARGELHEGLCAPAAFISSKYFYDPLGSRLFDAITRLPEYYLTRAENDIFSRHARDIGRATGRGVTLIDLGAGNCEKAKRLFGVLQPAQYVAVDISTDYLRDALDGLRCLFPGMDMLALELDLSAPFSLPDTVGEHKRLFFYPGSSIGNFTPEQAGRFLSGLHAQCPRDGGLLLGVDLVKDASVLDAAYDDSLGVTAAFNLNLLCHVNALLGSDFDVKDWRHRSFFNARMSRVEMHLEARRRVTVAWTGGTRAFEKGERIRTEYSYKYRLEDVESLLNRAAFRDVTAWTDEKKWFAVFHARA
ncbi:MAG TPA: L-histidine N(alpha)-methyltransferase [Burkholderiales bacterium]|nr:L-histidine N(alpha)-methyltransferase [Burkholderiales bacterium]